MKEWENTKAGFRFTGVLMTFLGAGVLTWAVVDLQGVLDERRGLLALVLSPLTLVIGIRKLRQASDAR